jgi:hypothetical protein
MNAWGMAVSVIVLGAVLAVLFVTGERRRIRQALGLAGRHEQEGNPEAASYCYAVAMTVGADESLCQTKIRELWSNYGPFDFETVCRKKLSAYCGGLDSCAAGYDRIVVQEIQRAVRNVRETTAA